MKNAKNRVLLPGLALAVALGAMSSTGCTNPETPAGFEGYVYHVPLLFGKMEFRQPMKGPATTGVSWRLYVQNIDMRKKSYKEKFKLLTSDNLSVEFEVVARIKPKDNQVKTIVEEWGGEHWYEWNVREPLRTVVRRDVINVSATDIQLQTQEVKKRISEKLREQYKDSPFTIESVDIGEIKFPEEVTAAIQKKIAAKQELERQEYVLLKAAKEARIHVVDALNVANKQEIISSTLDPLYVQRKAVQVYRLLATSQNKTVVVLPNTDTGTGMPLVLSEGRRKTLSADDKKLLERMKKRYMAGQNMSDGQDQGLPKLAPITPDGAPALPVPSPEAGAQTTPTPAPTPQP